MSKINPTIVLVSGGTGGHLFPALALGQELQQQNLDVHYITDQRGATHIKGRADARHILSVTNNAKRIRKYVNLMRDFVACVFLYLKIKPDVVMGFGGYPTLAPLSAAIFLRIPVALHEQNALLGRANRTLARFAAKIALSFEHTWRTPAHVDACTGKQFTLTGNPVRPVVHETSITKDTQHFNILVIGGSQGAKIFCDILPPTLALLKPEYKQKLQIEQQCRPEYLEKTTKEYEQLKINAQLETFIEHMGDAYAKADLVICRSGASTLAEILALGKPAILVPLPSSADNHQHVNATEIADQHAGWVYPQKDLTPEKLSEAIMNLMDNYNLLENAGKNAKKMSKPNAAKDLAKMVISLYSEKVR